MVKLIGFLIEAHIGSRDVTVEFNFVSERIVDKRSVQFKDVKSVGHTITSSNSRLVQSHILAVDENYTIPVKLLWLGT